MTKNLRVAVIGTHAICTRCQANASITHALRNGQWLIKCNNCGFDQARREFSVCTNRECHPLAHHNKDVSNV